LPTDFPPPILCIVAGPNGSGKSTFFERTLRPQFPEFVNADYIARELSHLPEPERNLEAARRAEAERERLLASGTTFAFETVFSRTDYWLDLILRARNSGHAVPIEKVLGRYPGSARTALEGRVYVRRPAKMGHTVLL
jgi:predicted ABC-type ATPase